MLPRPVTTDTGPTIPSADSMTPGTWQGSHWRATLSHWYESTRKNPRKRKSIPKSAVLEADALTTNPTRREEGGGGVEREREMGERGRSKCKRMKQRPFTLNDLSADLTHRLVGLVVKASASRAEGPGFDSRLRRGDFCGSSHTSGLKIGTSVTTLTGAWRYRVSAGTGWPGVSILW